MVQTSWLPSTCFDAMLCPKNTQKKTDIGVSFSTNLRFFNCYNTFSIFKSLLSSSLINHNPKYDTSHPSRNHSANSRGWGAFRDLDGNGSQTPCGMLSRQPRFLQRRCTTPIPLLDDRSWICECYAAKLRVVWHISCKGEGDSGALIAKGCRTRPKPCKHPTSTQQASQVPKSDSHHGRTGRG